MRTIVAGSRAVVDYAVVRQTLDTLRFTVTEVISGAARGADQLGERWARERGIPCRRMPACWDLHGLRAGYVRNAEMVAIADALVAFWDGQSRGTRHVIELARAQRKIVVEVLVR